MVDWQISLVLYCEHFLRSRLNVSVSQFTLAGKIKIEVEDAQGARSSTSARLG